MLFRSLDPLLQGLTAEALLDELQPQGFDVLLVLAFPFGLKGLLGSVLPLGHLKLLGDGGMDHGHLPLGAQSGLPLFGEFVFLPDQPLLKRAELGLKLAGVGPFAVELILKTGVVGFEAIELMAAALAEFSGEALGEFEDGEVGVHGVWAARKPLLAAFNGPPRSRR